MKTILMHLAALPINNMETDKTLQELLIEAADYIFDNNTEKAQEIFLNAQTLYPESYLPYYNLALLYRSSGNLEKALSFAEKAENLCLDDCDTLIVKALVLLDMKESITAIACCQKALDKAKTSHQKAEIHNAEGAVYFSDSSFQEAANCFKKSLLENSEHQEARENLRLANTYLSVLLLL